VKAGLLRTDVILRRLRIVIDSCIKIVPGKMPPEQTLSDIKWRAPSRPTAIRGEPATVSNSLRNSMRCNEFDAADLVLAAHLLPEADGMLVIGPLRK
jgi:hypothetical protein